jgi:hypothetical protein
MNWSSYVLEGLGAASVKGATDFVLAAKEAETKALKAGDQFQHRPEVHHAANGSPPPMESEGAEELQRSALSPQYLALADEAMLSAEKAVAILSELDAKHKSIAVKTSSLHGKCKELAETSDKARATCSQIATPLSVYDSYYVIGSAIGLDFGDVSAKVIKALGINPNDSKGGSQSSVAGASEIAAALKPEVEEHEADAAIKAAIASANAGLLTPVKGAASSSPSSPDLGVDSSHGGDLLSREFLEQLQHHRKAASTAATAGGAHSTRKSIAAPLLTPSNDPVAFGKCLERVEACISYLASHASTHKNTATLFIAKYRHLLAYAIQQTKTIISNEVSAVCGRTTKNLKALYHQHQQHTELQQQQQQVGGASLGANSARLNQTEVERAEVMLCQVGFKAELPHLRSQIMLIEQRCATRPQAYLGALRECYDAYCRERSRVLGEMTWHKLQQAVKQHQQQQKQTTQQQRLQQQQSSREELHAQELLVVDTIRTCCSIVARAAASEATLFHSLFITPPPPAASSAGGATENTTSTPYSMPTHVRAAADAAFQSLMDESVGTLLVDALRPLLVDMSSLEALCDVVNVLKQEVIAELAVPRGPQLASLARSAALLVKDVQERLVFLSQSYIEETLSHEGAVIGGQQNAAGGTAGAGSRAGGSVPAASPSSSAPSSYRIIPPSSRFYAPLYSPVTASSGGEVGVITGILVGGQGVGSSTSDSLLDLTVTKRDSAPKRPLHGVPFALDYPATLLSYYLRQRSAVTAEAPCKPPSLYDSWHPSVEQGLLLISRLSRALEGPSFESMAQDVTRAVTRALLEAHKAITTRAGGTGAAGSLTPLPSPSTAGSAPSFDSAKSGSSSSGSTAGALTVPKTFALHSGESSGGGAAGGAAGGTLTAVGTNCDDYVSSRVRVEPAAGAGAGSTSTLQPGSLSTGLAAAAINPWGASTKESEQCLAVVDGLLFLIKNLLILREQLSPYTFGSPVGGGGAGGSAGSSGTSVVTRSLDFSSTSESFSSLLRGGGGGGRVGGGVGSLFRLSLTDNALLNFVWSSLPKVSEVKTTDCRVELEALLKSACDAFISVCCNDLLFCGELQRAATPSAVTSALVDICRACVAVLPTLRRRCGLYMGSAVTASILFKPIRDNLVRTLKGIVMAANEGGADASIASFAVRLVEASDQLAVDPTSPLFGMEGGIKLPNEGDARAVAMMLSSSSASVNSTELVLVAASLGQLLMVGPAAGVATEQ